MFVVSYKCNRKKHYFHYKQHYKLFKQYVLGKCSVIFWHRGTFVIIADRCVVIRNEIRRIDQRTFFIKTIF